MVPVVWRDAVFAIGVKGQVMWALRQDTLDDGSNSIRRCLHLAGCFMKGVRSRPQTMGRGVVVESRGCDGGNGRSRWHATIAKRGELARNAAPSQAVSDL